MRYTVTWRAVSTTTLELTDETIAAWAVQALPGRFLGQGVAADADALAALMAKNENLRKGLASAYLSEHPDLRRAT